jgi:DNA topoisomerase III
MEHGQLDRAEFMKEIEAMTRHIVERAKSHESDTVPGDFATLSVPCPKCGGEIKENYKKFQCQNCDFSLWKIVAGRQFETKEVEELITKRVVGPLQGFRSRMGKPFAAIIKLPDTLIPEFDFGQGAGGDADEPVDFSGQQTLGPCPKCGKRVFEHGMSYVCEAATGPSRTCDFRSGKIILQRPIARTEMEKLLATGKTDLLHKFISKKGRPFSAFLVKGGDGKVSFEFAPRIAKAGAKTAGKVAEAPAAYALDKAAAAKAEAIPLRKAAAAKPAPVKTAAKKTAPVKAAKTVAKKAVAKPAAKAAKTAAKKAPAKKARKAA